MHVLPFWLYNSQFQVYIFQFWWEKLELWNIKFFIPLAETRFHNGLLVISTVTPDSLGNNLFSWISLKAGHLSTSAVLYTQSFKETCNSKMTNICSEWMKAFRVGEECYLEFVWSGRELMRWQTNADEVSKVLLLQKIIWFLCNLCVWNTADLQKNLKRV